MACKYVGKDVVLQRMPPDTFCVLKITEVVHIIRQLQKYKSKVGRLYNEIV